MFSKMDCLIGNKTEHSYCEKAIRKKCPELPQLHSYLFRRSRAMHLYQAGAPLPTVSEWLGHSNIETTRFYAKVTAEMKRDALHKLSESDKSVFKDDVAFKYAVMKKCSNDSVA